MRIGRGRIPPEVKREVEVAVMPRLKIESDKAIMRRLNVSRSTIYLIMREARARLDDELMKHLRQPKE